jgi:hypothetical protein
MMTANRLLTGITVVLGIISCMCLTGYYLALHDIYFDYVSPKVLLDRGLTLALPAWTLCPGEWRVVSVGFWAMAAFHVMLLVTFMVKRIQAKKSLV